eukprot:15465797-Alexandrium_andersonii.AAC.1
MGGWAAASRPLAIAAGVLARPVGMRARSWAPPTVGECRYEASTTTRSPACCSADVIGWRFPK